MKTSDYHRKWRQKRAENALQKDERIALLETDLKTAVSAYDALKRQYAAKAEAVTHLQANLSTLSADLCARLDRIERALVALAGTRPVLPVPEAAPQPEAKPLPPWLR